MIGEIEIIKANENDIDTLSFIHAESWRRAYKGIIPQDYLDSLKNNHWVSLFGKGIQEKSMDIWIAKISNEAAGCICIGESRHKNYKGKCEIISIYIIPKYWGKGVGTKLMNKALEIARDNYKEAVLWVLEDNERAKSFYKSMGFKCNQDEITCNIAGKEFIELGYIINLE